MTGVLACLHGRIPMNGAPAPRSGTPADGYTVLHFTNLIWLMPLFRKVGWDPARDFAPVAMTIITPNVVVVHPSLPAKSIKELIALARARPAELNYGSDSTGSANHVAAELFKSMAGVNLVRINYKGAGTAIIDLVAVKDRLFAAGVQVVGSSPDEAAAKIKSETARMGKVIREAGLRE